MGLPKQFAQLSKIIFGQTASSNLKMTDMMAVQHVDISGSTGVNTLNQISVAQALCEPVAISTTNNPSNGAYVATCENYPDFSITYKDNNDTDHYLYGLKVRVRFDHGITYGAVGGNTPTLNINGSGALQILAQGKPVGKGAATDGQFLELTLVPYGNSVAWDADSNVLESTSDYTIYTDGRHDYKLIIENANFTTSGSDGFITIGQRQGYKLVSIIGNFGKSIDLVGNNAGDYYAYVKDWIAPIASGTSVTVTLVWIHS